MGRLLPLPKWIRSQRDMKCLILSAGEGTRLRPLTLTVPKPLIPVGSKPVIQHIIDKVHDIGIKKIVCNVHYLPEKFLSLDGVILSHEKELLGEEGTILNLKHWLAGDPFFVINGDTLSDVNLHDMCYMLEKHQTLVRHIGTNVQHTTPVYAGISLYPENWFRRMEQAPYLYKPNVRWIDMGTPEGLEIARSWYGTV